MRIVDARIDILKNELWQLIFMNIQYIICRKFQEAAKRLVSTHLAILGQKYQKGISDSEREKKNFIQIQTFVNNRNWILFLAHVHYIYRLYHSHIHIVIYILYIYIKFIINIVFVWVLDFVNNFSPYTCVNFLESLLHTNISSINV